MIPKQLFFIWFGDKKPDYIDYSINCYKQLNKNFVVDFIYYKNDEIVNSQDNVINLCKNYIWQTNKGIRNKYYDYITMRLNSNFNFVQILSDVIRFEILYYYGGIYVDCDTFPIKPFDDVLLNNTNFSQNVMCFRNKSSHPKHLSDDKNEFYDLNFVKNPKNYHCYTYTDIYFIGLQKEYTDKDIVFTTSADFKNPLNPPWIRNMDNTKTFKSMRDRFYKCELKLYEDFIYYSQYILHLCGKKWQHDYKSSPMYTEYDDVLYGDK